MPKAGSKGRGAIDGLPGSGETGSPAETPQILPAPSAGDSCRYALEQSSVDRKAEEMGGLGKCWKKS